MPIIDFDETTLRPNYPADGDRNLAGYFSHNKSRSTGIYVPPTCGEWNRFKRFYRLCPLRINFEQGSITAGVTNSLNNAKNELRQIDLVRAYGINAPRFIATFTNNPTHVYAHRSNSVGTDAILLIQTALNMYVNVRESLGLGQNWKVDFIQSIPDNFNEHQDDIFRGRCLFKLRDATIRELMGLLVGNTRDFWNTIFDLYETLARSNYRIMQAAYREQQPNRTRRSPVVPTNPYITGTPQTAIDQIQAQPRVNRVIRSNEPAPTGRLAQEYLSRVEVDDSIPSDQLAEMLRRMGNQLSAEVRNMIYDMLTSDFNRQ